MSPARTKRVGPDGSATIPATIPATTPGAARPSSRPLGPIRAAGPPLDERTALVRVSTTRTVRWAICCAIPAARAPTPPPNQASLVSATRVFAPARTSRRASVPNATS